MILSNVRPTSLPSSGSLPAGRLYPRWRQGAVHPAPLVPPQRGGTSLRARGSLVPHQILVRDTMLAQPSQAAGLDCPSPASGGGFGNKQARGDADGGPQGPPAGVAAGFWPMMLANARVAGPLTVSATQRQQTTDCKSPEILSQSRSHGTLHSLPPWRPHRCRSLGSSAAGPRACLSSRLPRASASGGSIRICLPAGRDPEPT